MPSPAELLAVARQLLDAASVTDAHLRRAVSTGYYALFHHLADGAARAFTQGGAPSQASFALIYRGMEHGKMKAVCVALAASRLNEGYQRSLGRSSVSQDMRDFASAFPSLQEARHRADYDPMVEFQPSDVNGLLDAAALAIEAFDRAPTDERTDVLALMLVGARG